jgi:hypothetical protein
MLLKYMVLLLLFSMLQVCADTMVGGPMMRGVSGGQRKRVTTGEMMVGPAKTLLMDEISTGLDSSTTYLIVRCIRNYVHLLEVRREAAASEGPGRRSSCPCNIRCSALPVMCCVPGDWCANLC